MSSAAVNSLDRIGRPFPGFFVWNNLFIPAAGESHWTGVSSGLEYRSWLLAVDDKPVTDSYGLEAELRDRRAGEPVRYQLEREGQRYSIEAPLMKMDPRAWGSVLGIYIFDAPDNHIGPGNIIAFNDGAGVAVEGNPSTGNVILHFDNLRWMRPIITRKPNQHIFKLADVIWVSKFEIPLT